MNNNLSNIGKLIAYEYLRGLGFKLIDRGYRKRNYKIDFVMKRSDGSIRFVDVNTIKRNDFSSNNTTLKRKHNLLRSSQIWLELNEYSGIDFGWDYIGVNISSNNKLDKIIYIQDFLF